MRSEARKASDRRYRERNREKRREEDRRRPGRTPEQKRIENRRYRAARPEVVRGAKRRWLAAHPEANRANVARHARTPAGRARTRAKTATRRARLRGAFVEAVDPDVVLTRDCGRCGICGGAVGPDWHLDHIIALANGGEHSYGNTQVTHARCNLAKGA